MPINTPLISSVKATCTEQITEWIEYKEPLTDKLFLATGEAQLELIGQQWISTDFWSKNILEIQDSLVFQREITMKSHETIYWYARSIIPQSCYNLDPVFFDRLKQETIKNLIFDEPRVCRIHLIHYPIDSECVEFSWVKKYSTGLQGVFWVRIAEFSFQEQESFYLVEILLPSLEHIIK